MPKKSKKRGNRSITTHRKKYKVSSKSVTTTNVQPLPSQPSPVQQVTVDNGDSSVDSALRLRSTIKPPACNDADKELPFFDIAFYVPSMQIFDIAYCNRILLLLHPVHFFNWSSFVSSTPQLPHNFVVILYIFMCCYYGV